MIGDEPDPLEVLKALGVSEIAAVLPVHDGWGGTTLWRVERAEAGYALRLFGVGEHAKCRREALAMRSALAAGVPAPEIHGEGTWEGRPALLLSWCRGRMIADELRQRPWRTWELGVLLGRAQAAIHAAPVPPDLVHDRADWIAWAGPTEEPLQAHLRALAPRPRALLHLDFHPLNVLVDGREITGVLDWENVAAGDPRADVARTFTILSLLPVEPGLPRLRVKAIRRLLVLGWRRGYEAVAGPLGDLTPFYAWAGAMMVRDLAPKLGQPGVWLQPADLERISHRVEIWKRRAGVSL